MCCSITACVLFDSCVWVIRVMCVCGSISVGVVLISMCVIFNYCLCVVCVVVACCSIDVYVLSE